MVLRSVFLTIFGKTQHLLRRWIFLGKCFLTRFPQKQTSRSVMFSQHKLWLLVGFVTVKPRKRICIYFYIVMWLATFGPKWWCDLIFIWLPKSTIGKKGDPYRIKKITTCLYYKRRWNPRDCLLRWSIFQGRVLGWLVRFRLLRCT